MAFEHVQFTIPDSADQIRIWRETRGKEWCEILTAFMQSPSKGKVLVWNSDRYYELTYLWDEEQQTAVEITRYWIGRGLLPFYVTEKAPDGTGHRGVVDGMARRMQSLEILRQRAQYPEERVRNAIRGRHPGQAAIAPPPVNRTREIVEMRRLRNERSGGSFESLSREDRGLPSAELAQQQHPAYPDGVTYDAAHRMENGRTTIFTVVEQQRLGTLRNILDTVEVLMKAARATRPSLAQYQDLKHNEKDLIHLGLRKMLPEVKLLIAYLENLPSAIQPLVGRTSLPQTSQPGADLLANSSTLGPSNN